MGNTFIQKKLAGIKRGIRGFYTRLYILTDTCDTCTVNNYIRAIHENRPRAIVEKGFVFKSTLSEALTRIANDYSMKLENMQVKKANESSRIFFQYRSEIDLLTIGLNLAQCGIYDEIILCLREQFHVIKKKPTNRQERQALIKSIESLIKNRIILLNEQEEKHRALEARPPNTKTAREVFITNIMTFNEQLELPYNLSLNMTLTEYIGYAKKYDDLIKKLTVKNG